MKKKWVNKEKVHEQIYRTLQAFSKEIKTKVEQKTILVKKPELLPAETKTVVLKQEQKVKAKALDPCVCTPVTSIDFCLTVTVPSGFEAPEDIEGNVFICVSTNTNDLHCQNLKCAQTVDIMVDNPCAPDTPIACQGIVELNKLHYCGSINILANLTVIQQPLVFQTDPDTCVSGLAVSRYISLPIDQDICVRCEPFDCSTLISPLTEITNLTAINLNNPCEPTFVISGTLNFDTAPCAPPLALTLFTADGLTNGSLYIVDETDGSTTAVGTLLVGGTDPVRIGGMAYNFSTNVMYGVTTVGSPNFPLRLVTIDTSTAAVTVIDTLGNGLGFNVLDITFDASSSTLYGVTTSGVDGFLLTIDTSTGVASSVGSVGTTVVGGGLSFFPLTSGPQTLYLSYEGPATEFLTINPATGAQTGSLDIAPDRNVVTGMTTNTAETLLLAVNNVMGSPELISIDTTTGVTTVIGSLPAGNDAIALGLN